MDHSCKEHVEEAPSLKIFRKKASGRSQACETKEKKKKRERCAQMNATDYFQGKGRQKGGKLFQSLVFSREG